MGHASRATGGPRTRGNDREAPELHPNAAALLTVPDPGQSTCPVCTRPGYATIDARGVRVWHSTRWPCRYVGRFADLVSTADPVAQAAWITADGDTGCPRCTHRRDAHDGVEGDATLCAACTCPGPYATTNGPR